MLRHRWVQVCIAVISLALLLVLLQGLSAAEQEQSTGWEVVGQIGGPTQAVDVQGEYAYVSVGLRLIVLDISDPTNPTEVGSTTPFPYFVEDIAVSGTLAYVAAGGAGLRVVDISDPANPTELGDWDSPGYAEGVAVLGNTVYLADGPYGLQVVDVSDPAHPTPIGAAYDMNYAFKVAVSGQHAYIAAAGAGLLVADVSDPAHPLEIGALDTPGYAQAITVTGEVAYIADEWAGVQIADVSDPANPSLIGSCKTPGWAFGVAISGTHAFVADAFMGLRVLDVSDPAQPTELGGYDVEGGHAGGVAVAGNVAYVADRNWGVRAIDVTELAHPIQMGWYNPLGYAKAVAVAGDYAYVAAGSNGLRIVDVSQSDRPVQLGSYDTQGDAVSVAVSGEYAYVAAGSGVGCWLHVVDVSDPTHPAKTGLHAHTDRGGYYDIVIEEGIAYLADESGLELVSVSDPFNPTRLGHVDLDEPLRESGATGVAVDGSLAYVAVQYAGLKVVDVSDPATPTWVGSYDSGQSFSWGVAIQDNVVYVADYSGVRLVDVSDPFSPAGMGFCETPGEAYGVAISGTMAYVAAGSRGIAVVDVADPHTPTLAETYNTLGYAFEAVLTSDRMYVADGFNGLLILEPPAQAPAGETLEHPDWSLDSGNTGIRSNSSLRSQADEPFFGAGNGDRNRKSTVSPAKPNPLRPDRIANLQARSSWIASTCSVTSTSDGGIGTLRWCLENAVNGTQVVFDPTVFPATTPVSITLSSPLPWLTQGNSLIDASSAGVILDGSSTLPGTTGLVIDSSGNTIRGLQILGFPADGIDIIGGMDNLIGGDRSQGSAPLGEGNLISGNSNNGISISGGSTMSNTVVGNFIGVDLSGIHAAANENGVIIGDGASHNVVGGVAEDEGNVIGGNRGSGVTIWGIGTDYNVIRGNLIGTDPSGALAVRSADLAETWTTGVHIHGGAHHNVVGPGNVINGHTQGIQIHGVGTDGNIIIGNRIGTNSSGTAAIGNSSSGITITDGAQHNLIGGSAVDERNIISGNGGDGVNIYSPETMFNTVINNYIGTDASGAIALGNQGNGIWIGGHGNTIGGMNQAERNVISGNGGNGIGFIGSGASANTVAGNYIGTDALGTEDLGNGGVGVALEGGAFSNLIEGNLSSGNGRAGLLADDGDYNTFVGNRVGTDAWGTKAIPNDWCGVYVGSSSFTRIGGTDPGEGNLVSGNACGIEVGGPGGSMGNLVLGNLVGTDSSGTQPLANLYAGVTLGTKGGRVIVGGATASERNVISGNGWPGGWPGGIVIGGDYHYVAGNYVGTNAAGTAAVGNRGVGIWFRGAEHSAVQGNLIAYNSERGVVVESYAFNTLRRNAIYRHPYQGIVLAGGNNLLPAPVLLAVTATTVSGTACPGCTVEIFSDDEDEGRLYEGTAVADGSGNWTWTGNPAGPYLTATATDEAGNTSPFSDPRGLWEYWVYLPVVMRR